jgi:glycosyltransferase involved in cell wall biosynthesis
MSKIQTIWIIDPYSTLPEEGARLGRYHQLAETLVNKGYNVVLFISNFSHTEKKYNLNSSTPIFINGIEYRIVKSTKYSSHISISRIIYERNFIKNLISSIQNNIKPELIVIRDPAIFISSILTKFIKKHKIKYLVDIIDLWPELFELVLPKKIQKYSKYIFSFFYFKRKKLFEGASAYSAVSPDYLKIATDINNKLPSEVIYWGCDFQKIQSIIRNKSTCGLEKFALRKDKGEFWLIYSGTLGDNYDIKSIFFAAELLTSYSNIKFIIAGSGPLTPWIHDFIRIKKPSNVVFIGQVKSLDLFNLFGFCDIGLTTYANKSTVSMPIKCYDYFASGLPIINSLNRNLGKVVIEKNLGYNYIPEDVESLKNTILDAYFHKEELYLKRMNVLDIGLLFDQTKQYQLFGQLVDKVLCKLI